MSISEIQRFVDLADSDPEVQARLKAIGPADSAAEVISAIAKSRGIDFSPAELRVALGKSGALTETELDQVAGGVVIQGGIQGVVIQGGLQGVVIQGGITQTGPGGGLHDVSVISAFGFVK